jgi:hypothetical protein
MNRPRALVAVLALFAVVACASSTERATEHVIMAWDLSNPHVEITQALREELGIPKHLATRGEIVEHYFQLAARIDAKGSAAYYNLGLYYLDVRDCDNSTRSLQQHLSLIPDEEDTTKLLSVIEAEGCAGARLYLSGMDAEQRRAFLEANPAVAAEFE